MTSVLSRRIRSTYNNTCIIITYKSSRGIVLKPSQYFEFYRHTCYFDVSPTMVFYVEKNVKQVLQTPVKIIITSLKTSEI